MDNEKTNNLNNEEELDNQKEKEENNEEVKTESNDKKEVKEEREKEKKNKKLDLELIINLTNYILLFLSIIFTFSYLVAIPNGISVGTIVGMSGFSGFLTTVWFLNQSLILLIFLANKKEKKLATLLLLISLVLIAFFLMALNYQYLAKYNAVNSIIGGFDF